MQQRLTSAILVGALVRLAGQEGGAGYILHKGDPDAGAIILMIREKGRICAVLERILTVDQGYQWRSTISQNIEIEQEIMDNLYRRRDRDPDLWLVELDIANGERFVATMPVGA
jgi:hypothetical protein